MLVARDRRIPKPLRWIAGLGLLPIPGPVDEAMLLLAAPILFGLYREPMREAWRQAATPRLPRHSAHPAGSLDSRR
jgi:hypothetical protein